MMVDGVYGPDKSSLAPGCTDPNVFHHIDTAFDNNWAGSQRVAIYEDTGNTAGTEECGLAVDHEAFTWVQDVLYSNASYNQQTGCIAPHATAVASVITGSAGGYLCGASAVEMYYPNYGQNDLFWDSTLAGGQGGFVPVKTSICNAEATMSAYEWMAAVDEPRLAAVNESFGCIHERISCDYGNAREWEGVTQDFYARYHDMVVVKAAGNDNCPEPAGGFEYEHVQEACPFTLNSICVGSVNSALTMSGFSSDENPGTSGQHNEFFQIDREEPDVVAYGGEEQPSADVACVANPAAGTTAWMGRRGTSFAAPVITSMIALYREKCEPEYGQRFSQLFLRSMLRTMAFGANPHGAAYSTPKPGQDFRDGGGFLFADALQSCPDPAEPIDVVVNLEGGGPLPAGDAVYQGTWTSPGETQSLNRPLNYFDAPTDPNVVGELVLKLPSLPIGRRIRTTASWNGCADDVTGTAPGSVAVDFDVYLYHTDSDTYVWGSQSIFDNNEGFDFTVQAAGDYEVWLAWEKSSLGCEGTPFERVATWTWLL